MIMGIQSKSECDAIEQNKTIIEISEDKKDQSVKSTITIYNVEELSTSQITTIIRHEFGHAIGLAHTTATEELMAPTITTDYPYISPCTIHAIEKLYDGNQKSEVVCEI